MEIDGDWWRLMEIGGDLRFEGKTKREI